MLYQALGVSPLKSRLEAILHPAIAKEATCQVASQNVPWCILVVPLLVESRLFPWIDRVLVVDAKESVQIERVMARDQISRKQAQAILDAQAGRQQRLNLADDIIDVITTAKPSIELILNSNTESSF